MISNNLKKICFIFLPGKIHGIKAFKWRVCVFSSISDFHELGMSFSKILSFFQSSCVLVFACGMEQRKLTVSRMAPTVVVFTVDWANILLPSFMFNK